MSPIDSNPLSTRSLPHDPVPLLLRSALFAALLVCVVRTRADGEGAKSALNLQQCIALALEHNPAAARDAYLIEAADAGLEKSRGARLPTLTGRGSYRHWLDDTRLVPPRSPGEAGVYADDIAGLDAILSVPLYAGGGNMARIDAARAGVDAASRNLERTRQELVFGVTSLFHAILGQRTVIESIDASRKALEEHRRRVKDLLAAQKAARVDLLRTEVRLADLEQRRVRESNLLAIYHRRLANLLGGGEETARLAIVGTLDARTTEIPKLAEALETARLARPDIAAARAAVDSQRAAVAVAQAGGRPKAFFEASYGGRWALAAETRQPGADNAEDVGFVGLVLEVPIFEGGRVRAAVQTERSRLGARRESLRQLELSVRLDVETALLDMRSAGERMRSTDKAIEQAAESLRIEREKYGSGKGSMTDVLDAQAARLDADTNHARALVDLLTARAEYDVAVGTLIPTNP